MAINYRAPGNNVHTTRSNYLTLRSNNVYNPLTRYRITCFYEVSSFISFPSDGARTDLAIWNIVVLVGRWGVLRARDWNERNSGAGSRDSVGGRGIGEGSDTYPRSPRGCEGDGDRGSGGEQLGHKKHLSVCPSVCLLSLSVCLSSPSVCMADWLRLRAKAFKHS